MVYIPAAGAVLTSGPTNLSVTFTPTDTTNYSTVTKTVPLTVDQSAPVITWASPASIVYGTALSTVQLNATASVPGTFNLANSDYRPNYFKGYGFYSTYDFKYHVGIEGEFHQINDPDAAEGIYERAYEIGPRYVLHHGCFAPYAKVLYGRGVFNYPPVFGDPKIGPIANLAYNIFAIGGGVDYHVRPWLNVRAEYEYQKWLSFPPNGLTPNIFSVGAAYRFN